MAELNVQPKKRTPLWPWLLVFLGALILAWWLWGAKNGTPTDTDQSSAPATAATTPVGSSVDPGWSNVNFSAPAVEYEEISDRSIDIRGVGNYGIYGLGENVLFDEGKAVIRPNAEANLKQVVASINKRYSGGDVRVYGYTDSAGSSGANKELAQQRADAVKTWLQNNGIDAARISVNAIGEGNPVASNNTEHGRQQNRRVEIVARTSNGK